MNVVKCVVCGAKMRRNGKTKAGRTRWRCESCGASATGHVDNSAKRLDEFLGWLLSKERQADMPGAGRTFRRRTAEFWHVWPLPPVTGEVCRVVFVDGIHLARNVCVLISRSEEHVLGWYVAKSENSRAYKALMARVAPPDVVVTDGGSGFQKARRQLWPKTRVRRCSMRSSDISSSRLGGHLPRCRQTKKKVASQAALFGDAIVSRSGLVRYLAITTFVDPRIYIIAACHIKEAIPVADAPPQVH